MILLARPKRFELLTPRFVVWCSIQLSYGRVLRGSRREMLRPTDRGRTRALAIGFDPHWQGWHLAAQATQAGMQTACRPRARSMRKAMVECILEEDSICGGHPEQI